MHDTTNDIPAEDFISQTDSPKDPGYDEWAMAKIEAAIKYNREHPDETYTLEEVLKELKIEN